MPPLMPKTNSEDDKEPLPNVDLDDLVWDKEPAPDSREYLCIHKIPRLATPTPPHSPYQWPHPCSPTKESHPCHPSNLTKWKCPWNLNWWGLDIHRYTWLVGCTARSDIWLWCLGSGCIELPALIVWQLYIYLKMHWTLLRNGHSGHY